MKTHSARVRVCVGQVQQRGTEKIKRKQIISTHLKLCNAYRYKKCPVEGRGNLMFSQRNNPYCELLQKSMGKISAFL